MNINCVICSDLFTPSAEIFVTKCGHMFHYVCLLNWLDRSKSCPQCRNEATEQSIQRVYFNSANVDRDNDVGTVVNQIRLNYEITLNGTDMTNYKEEVEKYKKKSVGLRQEVANLEQSTRAQQSALHAVKEQLSFFKSKEKETNHLSEEIAKMRHTLKTMENADLKKKETEVTLKRARYCAHQYKKKCYNLRRKNTELSRKLAGPRPPCWLCTRRKQALLAALARTLAP